MEREVEMHLRVTRACATWLMVVAALFSAACGEDENGANPETRQEETAAKSDLETYCSLAQQLDEAGSEFFKELEQDPKATKKDYEKAEAEFVRSHQAQIDKLIEAAPSDIRADVDTLLASLKARAGLGPPVNQKEAQAAEKRVQEFEKENC